MSDTRELLRRGVEGFEPMPDAFERVLARRDRKRWNQRIAAGVVGIAVFVAAVWIVTSGAWFDYTQAPAVPGPTTAPTETGPSETGPTQTGPTEIAPPPARDSAAPDEVSQEMCSDGAGSRLELTHTGDRIKVRFEVYRSPVGHSWRIVLLHTDFVMNPPNRHVFFLGTRVAGEYGALAVQRSVPDREERDDVIIAKARDRQTGQLCWLRDAMAAWVYESP